MRHRTAAGRRAHHARQRARKQRYRAWEAEHIAILDGLEMPREARKVMYRLRHLVEPIIRRQSMYAEAARHLIKVTPMPTADLFVSTAGTEALPKLAEMVGATEEKQ